MDDTEVGVESARMEAAEAEKDRAIGRNCEALAADLLGDQCAGHWLDANERLIVAVTERRDEAGTSLSEGGIMSSHDVHAPRGTSVRLRRAALLIAGLAAATAVAPGRGTASTPKTLRVPELTKAGRSWLSLEGAYDKAIQAGLRVSLPKPTELSSFTGAYAVRQSPRAGATARAGDTVKLYVDWLPSYTEAPAEEPPAVVVPDFKGARAPRVEAWLERHGGYVSFAIRRLKRGHARNLLANFVVAKTNPAAGSRYRPVVLEHGPDGAVSDYGLTALRVSLKARRPR